MSFVIRLQFTNIFDNLCNAKVPDNGTLSDCNTLGEQHRLKSELEDSSDEIPYKIHTGDDNEGLICQALLTKNIEAAVELCLESDRIGDAIVIASTGGPELLARTQYRYLKRSQGFLSNIISALVTDDWSSVIAQCTTDSWKEALVATLTHCRDHVPILCERLGERLQFEGGNDLASIQNAILCYICAGNAERLTESWLAAHVNGTSQVNVPTTKELQDLIEIVVLFQKSLELQGRNVNSTGKLADLLSQYAGLLAAQGALSSALTYLGPSEAQDIVELRERLYYSLGHKQAYVPNARSSSQTQNIFAKSQPGNKFMQPRSSLGAAQQPPMPFNNAFNSNIPPVAPTTSSPAQLWNNPVPPVHPQAQTWNSTPFAPSNAAPPNPLMPPLPSKPLTNDPLSHPPRPSSVSSQGKFIAM